MEKAVGSDTAVFVGTFCEDYTDILLRDVETLPLYQVTSAGQSRAIVTNRLSYFYDLKGPSVTVDTAWYPAPAPAASLLTSIQNKQILTSVALRVWSLFISLVNP